LYSAILEDESQKFYQGKNLKAIKVSQKGGGIHVQLALINNFGI
jgi:hypothetical protein